MWKRLFFLLLFFVAAAAVALFYLWRQTTRAPDWYAESAETVTLAEPRALEEARREIAAEVQRQRAVGPRSSTSRPGAAPGPVEIRLDEGDVARLLASALVARGDGARLLRRSRGLAAHLENGRLELGLEVRVPRPGEPGLSAKERKLAREVAERASFLSGRDVFVAVSGRPMARDGRLALDGSSVQLGPLRLPADEIAGRLGLDVGELEHGVALEWGRLARVEARNGELVLELEGR